VSEPFNVEAAEERARMLDTPASTHMERVQCRDVLRLAQMWREAIEREKAEVARLRAERAIIDRQLLKSNLDATRWFIMEALRGEGEK
jgi:hypothetical protein